MVYGLIGTIGSGKSTVLNLIKKHYNCYCIQADHIGHKVLTNKEIIIKIRNAFGTDIINEQGYINRKALGQIVFNNPEGLKKLNKIMADSIKKNVIFEISTYENQYDFIVLEAAILIEANWMDLVDEIIIVTCNMKERKSRLINSRGMTEDEIENIIKNQFSEKKLMDYAHHCINNSFELKHTKQQIEKIFSRR